MQCQKTFQQRFPDLPLATLLVMTTSDTSDGLLCRLIFGAFTSDGNQLLGTACSMPVRVLANNDVPQGPSSFQVPLGLSQCPLGLISPSLSVSRGAASAAYPNLDADERLQSNSWGAPAGPGGRRPAVAWSWQCLLISISDLITHVMQICRLAA